ncbi:hypothetical protein AOQ84DRAFT_383743 [Glonium stellatum]|uniref:Uncharacterized protein n=1 Tax=Glonium stellatum TaxID=574774 RepID=A0A8E2EMK1_9PEZI|nr:hypothetical protein AOQ84DRAFT_383743 [Glonium stellatum]
MIDNNSWAFGQVLAVVLLAGPVIITIEAFASKKDGVNEAAITTLRRDNVNIAQQQVQAIAKSRLARGITHDSDKQYWHRPEYMTGE